MKVSSGAVITALKKLAKGIISSTDSSLVRMVLFVLLLQGITTVIFTIFYIYINAWYLSGALNL